jgi:uncharacterized protein YggU (UPF0235/DUF167 family)
LRIAVEAHPNARLERVDMSNATMRVWVRARPVEGQANAALEQAIAKALGLRRRQVHIVGGAASRRKVVDIDIPDFQALRVRLLKQGFVDD